MRGVEPYGGVFDAAGEGNPTLLPAGVAVGVVEVDVEVPIVGPVGSAARPLWRKHSGSGHGRTHDGRRPEKALKEG